jgi:hypothetical protein
MEIPTKKDTCDAATIRNIASNIDKLQLYIYCFLFFSLQLHGTDIILPAVREATLTKKKGIILESNREFANGLLKNMSQPI